MNQTTRLLGWIVISSFVIGIILMAITEHVDQVFLIGFGLFLLGVTILVVSMIWSAAGWAERKIR